MQAQKLLGLVFVLAGIIVIVLYLGGVFTESAGVALGELELEVERERDLPWLPWVAGGSIVLGSVIMLLPRR